MLVLSLLLGSKLVDSLIPASLTMSSTGLHYSRTSINSLLTDWFDSDEGYLIFKIVPFESSETCDCVGASEVLLRLDDLLKGLTGLRKL